VNGGRSDGNRKDSFMQIKKVTVRILITVLIIIFSISLVYAADKKGSRMKKDITVTLDFSAPEKTISPYIFGINDRADFNKVSPKAIRLGGNRMTAYNWENNKSNAGSDWKNQTDDYMLGTVRKNLKRQPGAVALNVAEDAKDHNVPYTLLTLQMAGYVANKDGEKKLINTIRRRRLV